MSEAKKNGAQLLDGIDLEQVIGGVSRDTTKREKFVSAFYCELCKQTVHLNTIYSLERAKKIHNQKVHHLMQ